MSEPTQAQNQLQRQQTSGLEFGQMASGMTGNPVVDILLCPERFAQLQRGATLFAESKLVPDHFKGNVGGCFVALQLAMNMGVDPFMLMQKIYVISGKLGIEAQVAVAVANQRKIFAEPLDYAFEEDPKNPARPISCTCTGILSANMKKVSEKLTWTEVEAEGWSKKGGSKWLTIPRKMFKYRTALWLIRTYAPEVLMGLSSIDEIHDGNEPINVTPKKLDAASEALDGSGGDIEIPPATVAQGDKKTKPAKEHKPAPVASTEKTPPATKTPEKPPQAPTYPVCLACGTISETGMKSCRTCKSTKVVGLPLELANKESNRIKAEAEAKVKSTPKAEEAKPEKTPVESLEKTPAVEGTTTPGGSEEPDKGEALPEESEGSGETAAAFNKEAAEKELEEFIIKANYDQEHLKAKLDLLLSTVVDGKPRQSWTEDEFRSAINLMKKISEKPAVRRVG